MKANFKESLRIEPGNLIVGTNISCRKGSSTFYIQRWPCKNALVAFWMDVG